MENISHFLLLSDRQKRHNRFSLLFFKKKHNRPPAVIRGGTILLYMHETPTEIILHSNADEFESIVHIILMSFNIQCPKGLKFLLVQQEFKENQNWRQANTAGGYSNCNNEGDKCRADYITTEKKACSGLSKPSYKHCRMCA